MEMGEKPSGYVRAEYPHSEITGRIIAAANQVHNHLGPGYEELIYQRALALELPTHDLDFEREVRIEVAYKGEKVGVKRVDFLIEDVLLEIKAKATIEDVDIVQALSYLKASSCEVGLLLSFGAKSLEIRRLIHTPEGD
jgi:GxxExxY protein